MNDPYAPQTAVATYHEDILRRQQRFVQEYVIDLNGTHAAIRAGYSKSGAELQARRLLAHERIADAVASEQLRIAARLGLEADTVVAQAARNALYDVRDAFDENGDLIPVPDMPDCIAKAIQAVDITHYTDVAKIGKEIVRTPRTEIKLRFADRNRSIDTLMKHLGLYAKDNDQRSKPVEDLMAFLESQNNRLRAVTMDAENIEVLQPEPPKLGG